VLVDEIVSKVELHGVFRIGYPDRAAAGRLIGQLRSAIAAERAPFAELIEAAENFRGITSGDEAGEAGRNACAALDAALALARATVAQQS
jgi:hypothetical protein